MTECVLWTRRRDPAGYGMRYMRGTGYGKKDWYWVRAHRQAYEDAHGPIPDGMHVHHRCENTSCVNVEHLQLLSNRDHQSALGHGKLTSTQAAEIRYLKRTGWGVHDIAAVFGVSQWTVFDIAKGRTWS